LLLGRRAEDDVPKGKTERPAPWDVRYFKRHKSDGAEEHAPAREFIASCPTGVRADIFATLKAVADAPPPQFSGGGRWEAMHGSMKGYFEVRIIGPGRTLYRVFCLLERKVEGLGLGQPSIITIDGMSKASGTTFSEGDYAAVRRLGDEYRARTPRSVI
jgi:hypothetical protein